MKSADIVKQLRAMHEGNEWAHLDELRAGTAYRGDAKSRIDFWVMNCWPSKKHITMAFEIKVSRADFMVEIKKPWKREAAMKRSHEFYFAAPAGMLKTSEIPEGCGLMEFTETGKPKTKLQAPYRKMRLGIAFIAALARRANNAEAALREKEHGTKRTD